MEVEALRQLWQQQDRQLGEARRGHALGRAETAARKGRWGVLLELLLAVVPVLWLGSFVADHIREPRFWIPAAALDFFAILSLAGYVRQYAALRSVDWSAPVAAIQRRLAAVRVGRVRTARWILLLGPFLWAPMLVVALKGFFGIDAWAAFGAAFVGANALFGVVFLAAGLWASSRWADRLGAHPFWRERLRDLAGRNLAEAEDDAAAAGRFAHEA